MVQLPNHLMKHHLMTALLILLPSLILAQTPVQLPDLRPDIEELMTVMRLQKMAEAPLEQIRKMSSSFVDQSKLSPEAIEKNRKIQEKTFAFIQEEMGWQKMKSAYAKIYAELFSPAEVKALLVFYKSPAGQAFLDKQPILMQKSMEMSQKKMLEVMPKLQEIIKQEMATIPSR